MKRIFLSSLCIIFCLFSCKNEKEETKNAEIADRPANPMKPIYIGTYTKKEAHVNGQAEGIYTVYQQPKTGVLEMGKTVAKVTNPSFVKTSGDNKYLYAVSELGPGDGPAGVIFSYKIKEDHSLEETGKISTESFAPCYITEDQSGRFVFVANYVGGVVMMYGKNPDGSLKKLQKITLENPEGSNPHSVNIAANNKFIYITDLGQNRIYTYILDTEANNLQPHPKLFIQLEEGTGPRHFEFSASQKYAFSINEHASTISTFKIEDSGDLSLVNEISTLPGDFTGNNSTADIHLHPSGKFLYGSNRGHNSIVGYKFIEETGALELLGFTPARGEKPRNFAISPDGHFMYVANQDTNNISAYKIDPVTGSLKEVGEPLDIMTPVCINFL